MNLAHLALLFGVGAIAGFINVNAGGGSTLTLPTLIFMGLDAALANGTNRVAIFIQNIFAVASFHKRKAYQFNKSLLFALFTLPGAVVGAIIATRVDNILFQRILGVVLIFIVFSMFFSRSYRNNNTDQDRTNQWLIYPALFGIDPSFEAPFGIRPKNRGPDQWAPVMTCAILVRDAKALPAYSKPSAVTTTVCVLPRHSLTSRAPGRSDRSGVTAMLPLRPSTRVNASSLRWVALLSPPYAISCMR